MGFELQPVLRGQLVELRPLRNEDYDALFSVASDPLIWEQHPANDRWKPEVFRHFFAEAMAQGGALIVFDAAEGSVIGSSRYVGYNESSRQVEIGYTFLARSHWGGRYNAEMKRLMLDHAFRFVDSVIFSIGETNVRSQKAIEKIGAVREGSKVAADGRVSWLYRIHAAR